MFPTFVKLLNIISLAVGNVTCKYGSFNIPGILQAHGINFSTDRKTSYN